MAGSERDGRRMTVEVAYATPERQVVLETGVREGATALEAVRSSGILQRFAEIDLGSLDLGIFGEPVPADRVLEPGDRVEIYRPLKTDPREARRQRVLEAMEKPGRRASKA